MTLYAWYTIFNLDDFAADDLVSREFNLLFDELGIKTVLVTRGCTFGILFEGVFLSIGLNDKNPFEFDGYAVFYDEDGNVRLGIANAN